MTSSRSISQWQCIQKNIGEWHGAFVQFSPTGQQVKVTPSVLTLKESEPGKTMVLTLERTTPAGETDITRQTFHYPGPAPYVLFFESGAFAQGTPQWSAFGRFGAEMSLKVGDKRVRYVVMYEATQQYTSQLKYVTLIGEIQKQGTTDGTAFDADALTISQLLGDSAGCSSVIRATEPLTTAPTITGTSQWTLSAEGALTCKEVVGDREQSLTLVTDGPPTSDPVISFHGATEADLTYQLMLLPKGGYCLLPTEIRKEKSFRIEVGWRSPAGDRTRLVRYYDTRGVWMESALIKDHI